MTRGTLTTLQVLMAVGAVAATGCSGPLPDGTVDTRTSALSGPPLPPPPPFPPPPPTMIMRVDAPSSMWAPLPSGMTVTILNNGILWNDVTLRINLTGVAVTLGDVQFRGFNPLVCAPDSSVPGSATVTCHANQVGSSFQMHLPITPTTAGTLINSITLTAAGVLQASETRQIQVSIADSADLSITGNADSSIFVGNSAVAFFYGLNAGPLPATGVRVTFTLSGPAFFSWVTALPSFPQPSCAFTSNSATCTVDSLPTFRNLPTYLNFTPTGAGDVSITASISGNELDRAPLNNTFTTHTTALVPNYADLSVGLTAGHQTVISKPLDYTITVTNKGPDTAGAVVVYDTLPWGTTFVSAAASQGSCVGGEWGSLQCDVGAVAAGAKASVAVVVTPTLLSEVTNTATVYDFQYGDFDLDSSNNEASATVTVHGSTNQLVTGPPTKGGCGLWPGAPIDALEDGDSILRLGSKPIGGWFVTSDGTGFQSPSSPDGLVVTGGPGPSKYMVNSFGFGFSNWGAAFGLGLGCSYDVSRFHAVRFDVKAGGTGDFFVEIPTVELLGVENGGRCTSNCYDYYRAEIALPDDSWYRCTIAFTDLRQAGWGMTAPFDVGAVTGAQFNIETWQAPYDLSIDNLEFVAPPKTQTSCVRIAH